MLLKRLFIAALCCLLLAACQPVIVSSAAQVQVTIQVDGREIQPKVPAGSSVETALRLGSVTLNSDDYTDPPLSDQVAAGMVIRVTRVKQDLIEKTETIPFERQTIRNETLQEGETRLLQEGVNGERHVTYRSISLNGTPGAQVEIKSEILKAPVPEIIMVGVLAPISPVSISGSLVYIENGNCFVIEGNTGQRRPLITTGDLDGRVLRLSQDHKWLLYTRGYPAGSSNINALWVARIDGSAVTPIDLGVNNVVHFADFVPNASQTIIYSTVEPREAAPGWQANNDLVLVNFTSDGTVGKPSLKLEINSGGVYGWWGTHFAWSRDGAHLAYSRPDGIGQVNLSKGTLEEWVSLSPYETGGDWAWEPDIAWSPLGDLLFYSSPTPTANNQNSVSFDLAVKARDGSLNLKLVDGVGLFSNPSPSGVMPDNSYQIAFLQAIDPGIANSVYHLAVMDQDASNLQILFPESGLPGLTAQPIYWAPSFDLGSLAAVVYNGNIWMIDTRDGSSFQVTDSGLITTIFWR